MVKKINYILILILLFASSFSSDLEEAGIDSTIYNLESKLVEYEIVLNQAELDLREFLIFNSTSDLMNSPEVSLEYLKLQNKVNQINQIYLSIKQQIEKESLNNQNLILEKNNLSKESISISDMKNLAEVYKQAKYYDDAINVYNQIINRVVEIFGEDYFELVGLYYELSNLYFLQSNIDQAKIYLQKSINIQKSIIIREQNNYLKPLQILKEIYKQEKNILKFSEADSLIDILSTNVDIVHNDSLIVFPDIYINNSNSNAMISEYSREDMVIDLLKESRIYLDNKLFTQASLNFIDAYSINPELLDLNFLLDYSFRDSIEINHVINAMDNILIDDSTQYIPYLYNGLLYGKIFNYDYSIINLKQYLEYNDNDITGLHLKGLSYYYKEDYSNAIITFVQAHLNDSENFYSNLYLGKSLIEFGEYSDGREYIILALMQRPNSIEANFELALSAYFLENFELAISEFQNTLLLDSENKDIFYYLAKSYASNNQYKQAMEAFKKCIEIEFNFPLAHFELGKIYEIILDEENAIKEYEIANKYIEEFDININELNYRIGLLYFRNNQYKEALLPFREYVINNLDDYESMDILGQILIYEERFPEAIEIYMQLLEIYPDNFIFYNQLATAYYNMNHFNDALYYFEQLLDYNEEDQSTLLNIGIIYNKINNFESAEKYLSQAINCGNINKEILSQLGIAYEGQKKYVQALQVFKEALKMSLNDPILNYQIGYVYMQLGVYDLALKSLQTYIVEYPNDYLGYYLIGKSQFEMGEYDNAILSLEKSFNKNNSYLESLYDIGNCYLMLENFKKSAQYYKRVIRENPEHVLSRMKLIDVYLGLNKSREAKKECNIIYMLDRDVYNDITYCKN